MSDEAIPERAAALGLEPHPEGGWYGRTWTASHVLETPGGPRPAATLIHFLLAPGEVSAWHRVISDEMWLWHGPGALRLQLGSDGEVPDGAGEVLVLGPALGEGHLAQALVPAGVWQRTLPGEAEVLVSCLVSPGFSFEDWTLLDDE